MADPVETVMCPVCRVPHKAFYLGALRFVECPMAPPDATTLVDPKYMNVEYDG